MNPEKIELLLAAYETDVRFPDTSGMEHLDMLMTRTELEKNQQLLTAEQLERLTAADQQLARELDDFYEAISQVARLDRWREEIDPPASHWWWYLDVLSYAWPIRYAAGQQAATA